jgi:ribosomal protein S18 acetylase RimI-like enzyme
MTGTDYEIVDVNESNLDDYDFLCKKSDKRGEGYQNKVSWIRERFKEGLHIKLLRVREARGLTSRGFVEYVPGNHTWRAIDAEDYLVIHCLWVVGRWKNRGFGTKLIQMCIDDAKKLKKAGVVVVTSSRPWLPDKRMFLKFGYEVVDTAPPSFELQVLRFIQAPPPSFPRDWDNRLKAYGSGMTVVYTPQCPYVAKAVAGVLKAARANGIEARRVELKSTEEVRASAPSAYGTFNMVCNGRLLSYYYLSPEHLLKLAS